MKLTVIILNYNTKDLTLRCIDSVIAHAKGITYEIVLVENSTSESERITSSLLGSRKSKVRVVVNKENLGFAGGNNSARKFTKGEYVLFLNSDTEVYKDTINETLKYLDENSDVGAVTCKTILPNGNLDKDARRSFPTPWVSFTHFSGLDRIFPTSRIFARYWHQYESSDMIQEVDVIQGAYFLTRRKLLDEVGWFSEEYFLDGEDIDLCWKIKETGAKIIYYPKVSILHIKKASKKGRRTMRFVMAGVNSMEIFYKNRLWNRYPLILNMAVIVGIYGIKFLRLVRVVVPI